MPFTGKFIGGLTGFLFGGPVGAAIGASFGHMADAHLVNRSLYATAFLAANTGQTEMAYTLCITALAAKLAKCDGPVNRSEIKAFCREFNIAPGQIASFGKIFDLAKDNVADAGLFIALSDHLIREKTGIVPALLSAYEAIALSDGPITPDEAEFLTSLAKGWGLSGFQADNFLNSSASQDPYQILSVTRQMSYQEIHQSWRRQMAGIHPDKLAAAGKTSAEMKPALEKAALLNAAFDRIKKEMT